MPAQTPMITNFSGGMLSPKMEGRIDLNRYHNAVKNLENMIIYPVGSVTRRPGTEYITTAACSSNNVQLFPFIFSNDEAYILEFGQNKQSYVEKPGYIRFFKVVNDVPILLEGTDSIEYVPNPYTMSGSSPWVMESLWQYESSKYWFSTTAPASSGNLYTSLQNLITGVAKDYALNANILQTKNGRLEFYIGPAYSGAQKIYTSATGTPGAIFQKFTYTAQTTTDKLWITPIENCEAVIHDISVRNYSNPMILDTPYVSEQLVTIRTAQLADLMYFAAPYYRPNKLIRYSPNAWNFATYPIVGQPAEWNDNYGWPTAVGFYQKRLWFGGNFAYPSRIWASTFGGYDDFTQATGTTTLLKGFTFDLAATNTIDRILWFSPHKKLLIGTTGSIWKAGAADDSIGLHYDNVLFTRESSVGSSGNKAILLGNEVLCLGRLGKSVYSFVYSNEAYGYKSKNLSLLNDYILRTGLLDFVYQQDNNSTIWFLTQDKILLSCTYYPNEDVSGWSQHYTSSGSWHSFAIIPSAKGYDELWFATARSSSMLGNKKFIERMVALETELEGVENSWYLDCAKKILPTNVTVTSLITAHLSVGTEKINLVKVTTSAPHGLLSQNWLKFFELVGDSPAKTVLLNTNYNNFSFQVQDKISDTQFYIYHTDTTNYTVTAGHLNKKTNELINLDWLSSNTVTLFADGAPVDAEVDATGKVTVQDHFCKAIVGYKYDSIIESLRIETGNAGQTSQGRKKRIFSAIIRFYNTIGAKFGISENASDLVNIPFRTTSMPIDHPVSLFTGDKFVRFNTGFNRDGRVVVIQDQAFSMTVLGIIEDLTIHEI